MSRETKWLNPKWEPSKDWTLDDRIEVASAALELIERDVYAQRYGLPGRPNFTSVGAILREPAHALAHVHGEVKLMLDAARRERAERAVTI